MQTQEMPIVVAEVKSINQQMISLARSVAARDISVAMSITGFTSAFLRDIGKYHRADIDSMSDAGVVILAPVASRSGIFAPPVIKEGFTESLTFSQRICFQLLVLGRSIMRTDLLLASMVTGLTGSLLRETEHMTLMQVESVAAKVSGGFYPRVREGALSSLRHLAKEIRPNFIAASIADIKNVAPVSLVFGSSKEAL
jgi:hypothetical protein